MNDPVAPETRDIIARSRLFVCFVTETWLTDRRVQAEVAYAQRLGKPFRLLVWPGIRLPEDALQGVTDLETAPHTTMEGDVAQIQRWMEDYRRKETA